VPPPGPSLTRRAVSGAAWLSALNAVAGLAVMGVNAWLNHRLPDAPVQMGIWTAAYALLLLATNVFEAGIPSAAIQHASLERGALGALTWTQVGLALTAGTVTYALAQPLSLLARVDPAGLEHVVRLLAPIVCVVVLGLPPKAMLQRELAFRTIALVEGGSTLAFVAVALGGALRFGIPALVLGMLARHGLETACYWALSPVRPRDLLWPVSWKAAAAPLRTGLALAGQQAIGTASRQADPLIVLALVGEAGSGAYNQVRAFVLQPFSRLVLLAARAAFPTFSRVQGDRERARRGLETMQRWLALAVFPALAGLASVSPRLLALWLGHQYDDLLGRCVFVMAVLCAAMTAYAYAFSTVAVSNALGLGRRVFVRQAIAAALLFALMAAGAPWGLEGVAAGRALAYVAAAALLLSLARVELGLDRATLRRSIGAALPASIAMAIAVVAAGALGTRLLPTSDPFAFDARRFAPMVAVLLAQVAVGAATYGGVALALGVRPREEWRALRGARAS
jgi:O-antigen/teichoic acid export membrane protein